MERIVIDCHVTSCRRAPVWACWGPYGGRPVRSCGTHLALAVTGLLTGKAPDAGVKVQKI